MECLVCPFCEHIDAALAVAVIVENFARVPIVDRFVVVPLHELGYLKVEPQVVVVHEVVGVLAPVLFERFCNLRLRWGSPGCATQCHRKA